MKEAVVLLSGGMDSAVALAETVQTYGSENVMAISFDYGSKHNDREFSAARVLADFYDVWHKRISLDMVRDLFASDLLKTSDEPIPEGHYTDASMKSTVVPFRNGIMLSIAAGLAESYGASRVVIANHAGDHAIYPDCRPAFTHDMGQAIYHGTDQKVSLVAPFFMMSKTDICKLGEQLNVPLSYTYSCYNGRELHCGKCGTCFERKEAFRDSGVTDYTEYEA